MNSDEYSTGLTGADALDALHGRTLHWLFLLTRDARRALYLRGGSRQAGSNCVAGCCRLFPAGDCARAQAPGILTLRWRGGAPGRRPQGCRGADDRPARRLTAKCQTEFGLRREDGCFPHRQNGAGAIRVGAAVAVSHRSGVAVAQWSGAENGRAPNDQPVGIVQVSGSVLGNTKNLGQYNPQGTVILNGSGTAATPQLLEVMGQDYGISQLGFIHNFNYGTLTLANNTYVQLVNQYQNSSSIAPEALYVNSLVVPTGCKLDLNGLHVYARGSQISGQILHGSVTMIPNSGPIGFGNPTLGNVTTPGQLDQWTFFARAGQLYTVLVDPGTGSGVPPYLGYVQVKVADTNGAALAFGTNTSSGTPVLLSGVSVTNDGTYSVQVSASPAAPSSTGHYMVAVWQTTPNVQPLPMNQTVSGSIGTPYSVDQWTFGGNTNQQVRFHLVGLSGTGIGFDLVGPNGWKGFTNITADSALVTLPAAGTYSVNALSLNGQYGAIYAFQMFLTTQTNLPLGTVYQGQWAVSGQAARAQAATAVAVPQQLLRRQTPIK